MKNDPVMQAALLQAERLTAGNVPLGARAPRPPTHAAGLQTACGGAVQRRHGPGRDGQSAAGGCS